MEEVIISDLETISMKEAEPKKSKIAKDCLTNLKDHAAPIQNYKRTFTEMDTIEAIPQSSIECQTDPDQLMEEFNCSVCWILPRDFKVYTCSGGGHVLCDKCTQAIQEKGELICPMCRDKNVSRNKFAERILKIGKEHHQVTCMYDTNGCTEVGINSFISRHEDECKKRTVGCPSIHRGTCKWQGTWERNLFKHISDPEGKCIQKLVPVKSGEATKATIVDRVEGEGSVFDSQGMIHWLPMLLAIKVDEDYHCVYLNISRNKGNWTLMPRTYAPESVRQRLVLTMQVYPQEKTEPRHTYRGKVCAHALSNEEAQKKGLYMPLRDAQVRPMKRDRTLFEYSLMVEVKPAN